MSNSIDLISLRLFVRVAQTKRFAEAARHFDLPASSVSRRITRIEKTLGHRLLYRHTRAVRLTEVGERYYHAVREAVEAIDAASEQVAGSARHPRGTLRINTPVAFGRLHVAPYLAGFQAAYPEIEVELTLTDAVIDPVAEGADAVIRIGALADSSLIAQRLAPLRFVACAASAYLERFGAPQKPEDLSKHNCLVYKSTRGVQPWYFRQSGQPLFHETRVSGNLSSNNAESLVEAALQGQGIILFPTWLLLTHLSSEALVPVMPSWEAAAEPSAQAIHAIYPENRLRSAKVAVFLEHLTASTRHLRADEAGSGRAP